MQTGLTRFQLITNCYRLNETGRWNVMFCVTICVVLWKSADSAHVLADLWPLKRYGTFARFLVCLFEVTRLDPLSREFQIETTSRIQTIVCHSLRGVMKISRYNTHPKINTLIDCIYHRQALCRHSPIPSIPLPMLCCCAVVTHFST